MTDHPRKNLQFGPTRPITTIGREAVLGEVSHRLREGCFVILLGAGGIGKTTVALAVGRAAAKAFSGPVHFLDLGSLTDLRHAAEAVATSLRAAANAKDRSLELVDRSRSPKLLFTPDSYEHASEVVALIAEKLYHETD